MKTLRLFITTLAVVLTSLATMSVTMPMATAAAQLTNPVSPGNFYVAPQAGDTAVAGASTQCPVSGGTMASYQFNTLTDAVNALNLCELETNTSTAGNPSGSPARPLIHLCGTTYKGEVLPTITSPVTIAGEGSSPLVTLDGTGLAQPMLQASAFLQVSNLHLTLAAYGAVQSTGGDVAVGFSTFDHNDLGTCFTGNNGHQGGAAVTAQGSVTITRSTFESNTAATCDGGAVWASDTVTATQSTFSSNSTTSGNGGALYSNAGGMTLSSVTFSNNSSTAGNGGAVYADSGVTSVTVDQNSTFTSNSAPSGSGGALYADRADLSLYATFDSNTASYYGGAVDASNGSVSATWSVFRNNVVAMPDPGGYSGGGAIYASKDVRALQSRFDANVSGHDGGAIYSMGSGVLTATDNAIVAEQSIFTNNRAGSSPSEYGGAMFVNSGNASVAIANSILMNNSLMADGTSGDKAVFGNDISVYLSTVVLTSGYTALAPSGGALTLGGNILVGTNSNSACDTSATDLGGNVAVDDSSNTCGFDGTTTSETSTSAAVKLASSLVTTAGFPGYLGYPGYSLPLGSGSAALDLMPDSPPFATMPADGTFSTNWWTTDIRGVVRPQGGKFDAGSYESRWYTVTFNAGSGTVSPTTASVPEGGTLPTLPTPTWTGNTFLGWFTSASGGTEVTSSSAINASTTVYAQWSSAGSGGSAAPAWTDQALGTMTKGSAYSDGVSASNAATYSVSAGSLPAGLSLNPSTGAITGTPTGTGSYSFTITATGSGGSISKQFSGSVADAGSGGSGGQQAPAPAPAPDPVQVSAVTTANGGTGSTAGGNAVTIGGSFPTRIVSITVGGRTLDPSQWVQTGSTVTITMPAHESGPVSIQIFNGQMPLLPPIQYTYADGSGQGGTDGQAGTKGDAGTTGTGTTGTGTDAGAANGSNGSSTGSTSTTGAVVPPAAVTVEGDGTGRATIPGAPTDGSLRVDTSVANSAGIASATLSNGVLTFTPKPGFSGKTSLPLQQLVGGRSTIVQVPVVVNPTAPTEAAASSAPRRTTSTVSTLLPVTTTITWAASSNAVGYRVLVDGKVVGTSSTTSLTIAQLLGPKQTVTIVPLGNDGTVGNPVDVTTGTKPVLIATSNFASGSAALTAPARRVLDRVAALVKAKGFRTITLTGNTDNVGSKASAVWLSKARGAAVRAYLQSRLGTVVQVRVKAQADNKPVASNANAAGRAANRRVDIALG